MEISRSRYGHLLLSALGLSLLILANTGCTGFAAYVLHAWKGNMVPAEFYGLEGRRVAVVCMSDSISAGPNSVSEMLAAAVHRLLSQNVSDIDLVDRQEIADWTDNYDKDRIDPLEIGKGVDAEMIVAIDLMPLKLRDGQTLLRGRADAAVSVYDLTSDDREVFSRRPPQIVYPVTSAYSSTDMSLRRFRRRFIAVIAQRLSRYFYEYDLKEDFARDKPFVGS